MAYKSVFLSAATGEFSELREQLAEMLKELLHDVIVQSSDPHKSFPNSPSDLLTKLKQDVLLADLVVHIVGNQPGSCIHKHHLDHFQRSPAETDRPFFTDQGIWQVLAAGLAAKQVTYTHWEAFVALQARIPVLLYRTPQIQNALQLGHLQRLTPFLPAKHAALLPETDEERVKQVRRDVVHAFQAKEPVRPRPPATEIRESIKSLRKVNLEGASIIGRSTELLELDQRFRDPSQRVIALTGPGGVGKSTILHHWFHQQRRRGWNQEYDEIFAYTFSDPDAADSQTGIGHFVQVATEFFGSDPALPQDAPSKARRLAARIRENPIVLVLDGLEPILLPPNEERGAIFADDAVSEFFTALLASGSCAGKCILTSHWMPELLKLNGVAPPIAVEPLDQQEAACLMRALGVAIADPLPKGFEELYQRTYGYPLDITILAAALRTLGGPHHLWKSIFPHDVLLAPGSKGANQNHFHSVLGFLDTMLRNHGKEPLRQMVRLAALLSKTDNEARDLLIDRQIPGITSELHPHPPASMQWRQWESELEKLGLLEDKLDAHGRVRHYFANVLRSEQEEQWKQANAILFEHYRCLATQSDWEDLESAKLAVMHGCRAGHLQEAFELFDSHLDGKHQSKDADGNVALDNFPKVGSHAENLAVLSHFFEGDWTRMREGLSPEYEAEVARLAGFSLRTQGRLTASRACYKRALGLRSKALLHSPAGDPSQSAKLYGLLSKLDILEGDFPRALRNAKLAVQGIDPAVDPKGFTAVMADLGTAYQHVGMDEQAEEAFVKSRDPQIYAAHDILYAERMVQYCEYLIDRERFSDARRALAMADVRCEASEDGRPRYHQSMRLDYAINGLVKGKLEVEEKELELWSFLYEQGPAPDDSAACQRLLVDLLIDAGWDSRRRLRRSRAAETVRSQCDGDLIYAMRELEEIQRHDWLPKVYCTAAAAARLAARLDVDDSQAQWQSKALQYLEKAQAVLAPGGEHQPKNISLNTFYVDYLIEKARWMLCFPQHDAFAGEHASTVLSCAREIIQSRNYGRFTTGSRAGRFCDYFRLADSEPVI